MTRIPRIAPSFLPAADFGDLAGEIRALEAASADAIHLDVMDGQFVPNLTFGAPIIRSLRPVTTLPFDAHLMVHDPARLLPDFIAAGCDAITIHPEAGGDIHGMLRTIRTAGKRAGLALRPSTPIEMLTPSLDLVDQILILTVEPGFGGQAFMPLFDKIIEARRLIDQSGRPIELWVDGGINDQNAGAVVQAGADVLVSGGFVFKGGRGQMAANIRALKGL